MTVIDPNESRDPDELEVMFYRLILWLFIAVSAATTVGALILAHMLGAI